jgi:predicted AlkP superfamily phosphohydrolase/phosphomutase
MRLLPGPLRRFLVRQAGGLVGAVESGLRFGRIDLGRSAAYSEETPHFPAIWLNVRGRDPLGTVEPGADYEALRERILEELRAWTDPASGRPVVDRCWRREEVYHGDHVDEAPDILVQWALDPRGHTYQNGVSTGAADEHPVGPVDVSDPKWRLNKSGSHRPEGILVLAGSPARPGPVEGAAIRDVAPTVLHLLGRPVPADMDGRVLEQALDPGFTGRFPPRYEDGSGPSESGDEEAYSAEEEAVIAERLRGMGYLE